MAELFLSFGLQFSDLYARDGLTRLDAAFCTALQGEDAALYARFMAARAAPDELPDKDESQLLIDLAPALENFLAKLFGIEREFDALVAAHNDLNPVYACKRLFVQRRAAKQIPVVDALALDGEGVEAEICGWFVSDGSPNPSPLPEGEGEFERTFAHHVMRWLNAPEEHAAAIDAAMKYAAWALHHPMGQKKHSGGVLFKQPKKIDPQHLVHLDTVEVKGVRMLRLADDKLRLRHGFDLTDPRGDLMHALDETHYCIYCHNQGKDSCSKGMKISGVSIQVSGSQEASSLNAECRPLIPDIFKKNELGIPLTGCPLEEKISEMNLLKSTAHPMAALAVAVVDNPMIAGTGHRICNDCMKSCIYQKQDPVNIPLAETRVLDDVLHLPWGFEIYSLLTRWNPLDLRRPLPLPPTGRRVLVVGMGPAGYTLAHHLMNDGHTVVGIDGLKIEPLSISAAPIRDVQTLWQNLSQRPAGGFGGVAEYGITVRWDKNFLTLIRLLLERRAEFALFGGVRFGGTMTYDDAARMGFDHIALCMGAGRPTVLNIPGGMARGVRAASDFLMSLQLTGAAQLDSVANLQLRLPVVVVGGGLTAIDTATEALAYYPVQVEKFLQRWEALNTPPAWRGEEVEIAEEFIAHARALRAAKNDAEKLTLLKQWGGVTIAYRKKLQDAPSYRLNHEEVEKAMEEGICFAEGLEPLEIQTDMHGHVAGVACKGGVTLPARAILVAAGTSPNTVLHREFPEQFGLDGKYFAAVDEEGNPVTPERSAKPAVVQMLLGGATHHAPRVTFFGDLHPSFAGNVVKAMASAKQGYPVISRLLSRHAPRNAQPDSEFFAALSDALTAHVHAVNRLTPTIVEVVIRAPLPARNFQPGQFYRLQNFRKPLMEPLALTGAWVDRERGLVSLIVLEMGGSSNLCEALQPGETVSLMGPTGAPTEIPKNETVLLAGGGLGNAVLFSIGKAMRENGCRVIYFAGYKKLQDRYKVEEIEAAADVVVWCCDEAPGFTPTRPQDSAFVGNMVEAMRAYGKGFRVQGLGVREITLTTVNRIIAIGSDRMMAAVAAARHGVLKEYLNPTHVAVGSINSPMQCMMKEICAQCVQKHVNLDTGAEEYVFSCFNQDQELDRVCFSHLNERLKQNNVQEKLTAEWIKTL